MAFAAPWHLLQRESQTGLTVEVDHASLGGSLRLAGDLDEHGATRVERQLRHLLAGDFEAVILDLSSLDSIDSHGVLCLIKAARGYLGARELLEVIPPSSGRARETFELLRLSEMFSAHPGRR